MYNEKKLVNVNNTEERVLVPVVDIFETKDFYTLKLEMPGVKKDDLDITLDNNELEIKGTVHNEIAGGKQLRYSEYELSNYTRRFKTGNDINRDNIEAGLENGVLTVVLHKSEAAKPKKIEITVH